MTTVSANHPELHDDAALAQTVQFLTPAGELQPNQAAEPYLAAVEALEARQVQAFYRDMALARAFDRESTNLQRQGQLALWPPSEGQEGAQVGSAHALREQDTVFPSYREHAVALIRGVDPLGLLRLMRGETQGGWDPEAHRFRLYTLVIGSQTLHATGYAIGQGLDGVVGRGDPERDEATIVYFGDGASSQGDTNEALIFAASTKAPIVLFLQNNHWAISVPVSVQSRTPLYQRAAGFGLPSVRIDGNDVLASYAVTRHLLDEARSGSGPAFIEALTYRLGAHTTSDDPTKYRTRQEEASWRERDPLPRLERYLRGLGAEQRFFDEVEAEGKALAGDVRRRLLASTPPGREAIFAHVYSEAHPVIEEERAWLERYEASFQEVEG